MSVARALAASLLALGVAASAEPAPGPRDAREVEAFFDGAVPALLLSAQALHWNLLGMPPS